ncbi:hypothetical protein PVAP13_8KG027351 [Panicum virgatum]|uniref:Uncharacterized protein n=1 Tax=Panicum virgatum TaxID=38727 RepID=A0A8T0PIR1_PANVG|nr:hypothetical protein PVAP13_8KG027351 [Panicum virgatum]
MYSLEVMTRVRVSLLALSATSRSRRIAWRIPLLFVGAASLLFLGDAGIGWWLLSWFVDALLVDGGKKSNAGWCFHSFHHSSSRFPPLGWRWMVVRGARMCCRCHLRLQGRLSFPVSFGLCVLRHS